MIKKSQTKIESLLSKRSFIIAGAAIILGVLVWVGVTFIQKSTVNYAEEVAKPLEQSLVAKGAVKKSSYGEAGRVSDNRQPYYDAVYNLPMTKEEAVLVIDSVAETNGYKLQHASVSDKGFLGVADIYLDAWYFDTTNRNSTFSDLESGPIRLSFKLGDEDKPDQEGNTTVRVSVQLPGFKQ